jgi:hypothetical protein
MLKLKSYLLMFPFLAIVFTACEKEDQRDQYVGTWKGTQTTVITSLNINESQAVTQSITKSTSNTNQILFSSPGITEIAIANVNANAYTYEDYIYTQTSNGITMVITMTGGGSINGSVITEQGTITISANGDTFSGSWSAILNKQ